MMDRLIEWDKDAFLWLNELHHPWLDPVMFTLTNTLAWTPLFVVLLYMIVRQYGKHSWIFLLGLTVTIVLADQVTSSLMKPYFTRLRPSHEPALEGLVHIVNGYKGGKYGFASSHAANTFGAATFLFLLLKDSTRFTGFLFLWAAFVTYTRIYLGVHYPGDLAIGGIIGAIFGWLAYLASKKTKEALQQKL